MSDQNEVDKFYLREAYKYAKKSDDPINQLGAIIVSDNSEFNLDNILVYGANRFPKNVKITEKRLNNKLEKLRYIEHAERDVIFSAVFDKKLDLKNKIMYCPWITCSNCARTIERSGIKEVIGYTGPDKFYQEINKDKITTGEKKSVWTEDIEAGFNILKESGVNVRFYDGPIGDVELIFARHLYRP